MKPLHASISAFMLSLMTIYSPTHADIGTLTDSPLFLNTSTDPNIMFLIDDSGSMEWELLVKNANSGVPVIDSRTRYYILPTSQNGRDLPNDQFFPNTVPSVARLADSWRVRNHNYNALYYNPAITYQPWQGSDTLGNPLYSNAPANAAPVDPTGGNSDTLNLTSTINFSARVPSQGGWVNDSIYPAHYYTWIDTNSNGVVDTSDAKSLVTITSSISSYTGSSERTDCVTAPICSYSEEIQNFANWFTYYRKRDYVAKKAVGNVIHASDQKRMGLHLFNDAAAFDVAPISTGNNKSTLLTTLYGNASTCDGSNGCPGTPARRSLQRVGNIFEGASSPILDSTQGGACQQNFNVLLSDGYWNGSTPSGIGNADGDNNTAFDGASYGDAHSVTLGDVAMHYYERDLKPGLANNVPTVTGVDEADHQHLVNFSVAFGISGTLNPASDIPGSGGFSWPDPTDNQDDERVDDLWHAAYNGRGEFLSAQNPEELTRSLRDTLADITDRTGAAAAVAFNSSSLNANSAVYLALFNSSSWSGDLLSYALDPNDGSIASSHTWSAADVLDTRDLSTRPRVILSHDGSDGIDFAWANINATQKADLRTNPAGGTDAIAIGQARLNFIRGERSNEGSGYNFRVRGSRLGDIIHAAPVYVGKPTLAWPDSSPFPTGSDVYSNFVSSTTRDAVIYVGANDGMLHGFKESDGEEVLAYIPANLFSSSPSAGLHHLTNPAYTHRYYVDLEPTVADAFVKNTTVSTAAWRTVLIGGQRGGGRGMFALDISNPSNFTTSNAADLVLWEFTDPDLGYTYSKPTIALLNNGKWAAIFGNGYNDSGSGEAQLFIVYLEGGLDGTWTSGTDFIKITTAVGNSANRNGLATPTLVDLDHNGTADRVYAGDSEGNMWAFDLSDASDSNWEVAYTQATTPKPLFTAANNQAITSAPAVARHPSQADSGNGSNLMVYFGTGRYMSVGDNTNTDSQSFYAVWDRGDKERTRSHLIAQSFETGFAADVRVPSNHSVNYAASGINRQYGWYIDLPESGERVVTAPHIRGNIVYFNTMTPSSDPCAYGGSGWLMSLTLENGARPSAPVFDNNNDNVINASDLVSNGTLNNVAAGGKKFNQGLPTGPSFLGDNRYTPGTNTDSSNGIVRDRIESLGGTNTGRLSWEELHR